MTPLTDLLNDKITSLTKIRDSAIADYSTLGNEDKTCSFFNADDGNPPGTGFSTQFYSDVSFQKSTVKLAPGLNPKSFDVAEAICTGGGMDSVFKANRISDPDLLWQYFGSSAGTFRMYPGQENTNNFDPRIRPWYVAGSSTPRDIVIIIDTSASMNTDNRIGAAQDAVVKLLASLTPSDYVMIVTFSSGAKDPYVNGDCFSIIGDEFNGLVRATPENIGKLMTYTNNIYASGETNYKAAFKQAFTLFSDTKSRDAGAHCQKTILFLTDGVPTQPEGELDPSEFIVTKNKDVNARIFTFTLGDIDSENLDDTIPKKIACENGGVYAHISSTDNIVSSMSSYYLLYALGLQDKNQVVWSSPYYDSSGLGLMITVSGPAFGEKYRLSDSDPRKTEKSETNLKPFLGVAGVDITMSQLTAHLEQFTFGQTYPFICNLYAEVIYHPLMSPPATSNSLPVYLDITEVEGPQVDIYGIRDAILNGQPITVSDITVERSIAAGSVEDDGTRTRQYVISYECQPVPDTPFYLCYVTANVDFPRRQVSSSPAVPLRYSLYDRLDLLPGAKTDAFNATYDPYNNTLISLNRSTVHIPGTGWENSQDYVNNAPYATPTDADAIQLQLEKGAPATKPYGNINAFYSFDLTLQVEPFWVNYTTNDTIWNYIGFESGAFRTYPGHKSDVSYNPTLRPWYSRAIAYSGVNSTSVSTPYFDASGAGVVVTLSRIINRGISDGNHSDPINEPIEGVVGSDFSYPTFHSIFYDSVQSICDQSTTHCFLIDSSGYIVASQDFIDTPALANSPYFMGQSPKLDAVTGDIVLRYPSANNPLLSKKAVKDLTNEQFCQLYELNLTIIDSMPKKIFTQKFFQFSATFSVVPINNTNIFMIVENQTSVGAPQYDTNLYPSCQDLIPNACTATQQQDWDEGRAPTCPTIKISESEMEFIRADERCVPVIPWWVWLIIAVVVFLSGVAGIFYRYKKKSEAAHLAKRERTQDGSSQEMKKFSKTAEPTPQPVAQPYSAPPVAQGYAPPVAQGYAPPPPGYSQPGYGAPPPSQPGYGAPPPGQWGQQVNPPPPGSTGGYY